MHNKLILVLCTLMAVFSACTPKLEISDISVEQSENPLALDTALPRFSWKIQSDAKDVRQLSYRILVASSEEKLDRDEADLWDSGCVNSDQSQYVVYAGKTLTSRSEGFWKVRILTTDGEAISGTGRFGIGLLDEGEWQAEWIGLHNEADVLVGYTKLPARYLRKEFQLEHNIEKARLYICGLGLYKAYINGNEVGDRVLTPTPSDYQRTAYYNTYDVTEILKNGSNAIGVVLGNGRYTSMRQFGGEPLYSPETKHYGLPMLLMQLEVTGKDGEVQKIVSDLSWKGTCEGPIEKNNEFDGEFYNAGRELGSWTLSGYDDSNWKEVESMEGQIHGELLAQPNPSICIQERLHPVSVNAREDAYIVDMGQNMVGWLQLSMEKLQPGDTVKIRFAETLNEDGSLYRANLRNAAVTDWYVAGQETEVTWHPTFVYHGFRYAEITGLRTVPDVSDFEGQVFYDEMETTGTFSCSDPMINQIWKNAYWGIRGNYRGWPTDCPQRDERMPWTGDRTTGCYGEAYIFNNHLLYSKWLKDMVDAQRESGNLSNVAPAYWDLREDNLTWPAVLLTAAEMIYKQYGDIQPICKHYPAMKKWLGYMKDNYMVNGVMTRDYYGDWCMPPEELHMIFSQDPERITSGPLISTAFYYWLTGKMAEFAQLQNFEEDVKYYQEEQVSALDAMNREFFNPEKGCYGNNTVTANILPLAFGMVPAGKEEAVFANIVDKTLNDCGCHVSTGVVGIQNFMRTLTRFGRSDMAYRIASTDTYPSWGYMVKNGATTIWELWNGNTANPAMNSGNHVMLLGDLLIWMYEYAGGISALEPGFKKICFRPYLIEGLDYVNCSYESIYGKICSSWKLEDDTFVWDIEIPANTSAEVYVPDGKDRYSLQILESGRYHIENNL